MDLSFAKNMGTHLNNKYIYKLLDSTEKSTTGVIKTASKKAIEKKQQQLVISLIIKLQIKLQADRNLHKSYIHEIIQMKQIYQEKNVYFQKKENKSLMNLD